MLVTIKKIEGSSITFVQEGVKELQNFETAEWVKPEYVKLGDAEITITDGSISFCCMQEDVPKKPGTKIGKKPGKISAEGGKKWEDDIVTFETLLTKAHDLKKPFSIRTKMLAIDLEKNYALFKARVSVSNGEIIDNERAFMVFEGHGDATDKNIDGDHIKKHFIRMAETRAIVRALRWYTNNGVAEEEKK